MSLPVPLQAPTALEYFAALVAQDEGLNLLEAATSIAQDEHPGLDVQAVLAEVDALAERLRRRLPPDAAPSHRLRLLNHFFSQELGFAGNVNDYYAPANSYVHRVLATRRGLPIALAVIYIELAQQVGLRACGVGFPGHFLIRLQLPQGELVLDPFTTRSLSREALDEALQPYRRRGDAAAELSLEHCLRSVTPRQVLARMLRNLREVHRSSGDALAQLAVQQRLVVLLPDEACELRDRGLLLESLGHWRGAQADLQRYLELAPQAADHVQLALRLRRLRERPPPPLH